MRQRALTFCQRKTKQKRDKKQTNKQTKQNTTGEQTSPYRPTPPPYPASPARLLAHQLVGRIPHDDRAVSQAVLCHREATQGVARMVEIPPPARQQKNERQHILTPPNLRNPRGSFTWNKTGKLSCSGRRAKGASDRGGKLTKNECCGKGAPKLVTAPDERCNRGVHPK